MKRAVKEKLIMVVLALLYIFGLAGGSFALCYMSSGWKLTDLQYYAEQRIVEYEDKGRVSNWSNGGMAVVIYDAEGEFRDFFRMNGDPFSINFVDQSEEAVPSVLAGENTMQLFPFVKNYSKLGYTSFLYIGLPMMVDDRVEGAFFWIKELPDLSETLIAYAIVFTVLFVTIGILMLSYFRMHRRYEDMRGKYIDNITHELKTPIASIRALAEALTDRVGKDESERNAYYGMIIGEANRQEKMILDVLTLSKLQSNPAKPQRQHVHPNMIFEPLCEKHGALCELVGINFVVSKEIFDLPILYTDAPSIHQVLDLLLGNARKFTDEGGTISLSSSFHRGRVVICVSDTGAGISREDQPYIFERFYKGSHRGNDTGSGLGLAIAKETLAGLKEKIWVRSEEGKGTTFCFTISIP